MSSARLGTASRVGCVLVVVLGLDAMVMYGAALGVNRYADLLAYQSPALYTAAFLVLSLSATAAVIAMASQSRMTAALAGVLTLLGAACGLVGEAGWLLDTLSDDATTGVVDPFLDGAWPLARWYSTVTFLLAVVAGTLCLLGGRNDPRGGAVDEPSASTRPSDGSGTGPATTAPEPEAPVDRAPRPHVLAEGDSEGSVTRAPDRPAFAPPHAAVMFEVRVGSVDHGPYTDEQLRQFVREARVLETTLVRPVGGTYVPAHEVPGLRDELFRG